MKQCTRCKKLFKDFLTTWGKFSTKCSKCLKIKNKQNTESLRRIMRYPEEGKKKYREYYVEHRAQYKAMRFRNALKRKYGITVEDYQKMWNDQNGQCEICRITMIKISTFGNPTKTQPCIDHDHKTGKVRAILCRGCNLKLAIIDNNNFLQKAIQYLSKFEK